MTKVWEIQNHQGKCDIFGLENQCVDVKDMEAEPHQAENVCVHVQ